MAVGFNPDLESFPLQEIFCKSIFFKTTKMNISEQIGVSTDFFCFQISNMWMFPKILVPQNGWWK